MEITPESYKWVNIKISCVFPPSLIAAIYIWFIVLCEFGSYANSHNIQSVT